MEIVNIYIFIKYSYSILKNRYYSYLYTIQGFIYLHLPFFFVHPAPPFVHSPMKPIITKLLLTKIMIKNLIPAFLFIIIF